MPEPPLAVAVTVVFDPEQTDGLFTLILGKEFIVALPVGTFTVVAFVEVQAIFPPSPSDAPVVVRT